MRDNDGRVGNGVSFQVLAPSVETAMLPTSLTHQSATPAQNLPGVVGSWMSDWTPPVSCVLLVQVTPPSADW